MTDISSLQKQQVPSLESPKSLGEHSPKLVSVEQAEDSLATVGQLMRSTAQAIQRLYRDRLGHTPSRVTCDLLKDKLLVWADNSVTPTERVLYQSGSSELTAVNVAIKSNMRGSVIDIIERHLKVKVVTLLSDACYEHECTAIVALLSDPPQTRPTRTRY